MKSFSFLWIKSYINMLKNILTQSSAAPISNVQDTPILTGQIGSLALFIILAALTGCSKQSPPQASNTADTNLKTLVVARASEPEWLNPVAGHQHADSDIAMFRGLFKVNANNDLVADMARDWHIAPDGMKYTILLRSGIKWHDGAPFTAEDVKFTIEAIQNPKNHSGLRKDLESIAKVDVADPLTVQIILNKPLASLLSKLKIGIIPKHILEGKDFNTDEFNSTRPVGTGPFKFKEWKRGEYLVLDANPDYYGGRPKLDRVIYKFLPDPNVRLVQLKKGEVDVAELTPKQVSAIKPSDDIDLEVVDTADYRVMMFNMRDPLLQDVRLRQAIQYATDRQALVQGALVGYGNPAYGPLQFNAVSAPNIVRHDNNPRKAEALLTEAGWRRGADGIMVKAGKRLAFTLTVPANDPVRQDLAIVLAEQLHHVGIKVEVQVKDFSVITISKTQTFLLGGGLPGDPDDDLYAFFSSHLGEDGSNYSGYANSHVDDLLDRGRDTLDPIARVAIYQQLQDALIEDPPYDYLVYLKHIFGVRKGVSGFVHRIFGHGTSPLWNIEDWAVTRGG